MESQSKMPTWAKWILAALIIAIIIMGVIIATQSRNKAVDVKQADKKKIMREIDSVKAGRDENIKSALDKSRESSQKGNAITKTIDHEKFIVADTVYSAKCDFITNFQPGRSGQ